MQSEIDSIKDMEDELQGDLNENNGNRELLRKKLEQENFYKVMWKLWRTKKDYKIIVEEEKRL